MAWIVWEVFTKRWLERAERGKQCIDDGDRFISLWVAFNGWLKGKYGETIDDHSLIEKVKKLVEMEHVFDDLKNSSNSFVRDLNELSSYEVHDMRYPNDRHPKKYDGTFGSLIATIYKIRCNLFHGRKNINDNEKDFKLVVLAYRILLPLFKEYLARYSSYVSHAIT